MKGPFELVICQRPTGRYKVYVFGYADNAMDFANPRHTPVSQQPRLGFATYDEAEKFMWDLESDRVRLGHEYMSAQKTAGGWIPTEWHASRCAICKRPTVEKTGCCRKCWERILRDAIAPAQGSTRSKGR